MSPDERANAVAKLFARDLPTRVPELERIVTSAIKRALTQQLVELSKRLAEASWAAAKSEKTGTK